MSLADKLRESDAFQKALRVSKDFTSLVTPHHIGMVVGNLEKAMDGFTAAFGSTFSVFEATDANSRFSGSSASFGLRIGIGHLGPTMVELISPVAGATLYSTFLSEHGPGLHHLGFCTTDLAGAEQRLDALSYNRVLSGSIQDLCRMSYYQAPELGFVIEPLQLSAALPVFLIKNAKIYKGANPAQNR
ncbi:MAG: VOC family protein [Terriglobia bacterium]